MQVSVEAIGDIERRLTVQIPAARIEQEVDNRLRSLARTARVDGFRPGKVPFKVVQLKFEDRVRQEVVNAVIDATYKEAVAQQNLRPVGDPRIEPTQLQQGMDLHYTALIEIYPEVHAAPVSGTVIRKPVAEVTEKDVDDMIEVLRRQRAVWQDVARPAREGDRVIVDYAATMDGASQSYMEEKQAPVVVGSKTNLEGFEERLIGLSAGDRATIDLRYPDSHPNTLLAGKPVQFQVAVTAVAESIMPAIDENFAQGFGISEGGIERLRGEIAANMNREMSLVIKARIKDQVLDALFVANPVKAPTTLVEQEIDRLVAEIEQSGQDKQNVPRELLRERAVKRVTLGMVIGEIVKSNRITVDPARVRNTIETIASSYEDPQEVIKWYYSNRDLLSGIEALALEDQVVDWFLGHATVQEAPSSFHELMNPA